MNVTLTNISPKHLSKLRDWRNSENIWKFNTQFILLNLKNQNKWFEQIQEKKDSFMFMINHDKKIVGVCGLVNYQKMTKSAEIAIIIGDKKTQNKGIGKKSLDKLLQYGFTEKKLHRIEAHIIDFNLKSRKFFKKMGFSYEATLRDALWRNGKWNNIEIYSILKSEFENK